MEIFAWNDRYLTGCAVVDAQHQQLMGIVNRVGAILVDTGTENNKAIEQVFHELAAYANLHFRDEETLMREAGLDAGYVDHHVRIHRDFVEQIKTMWGQRETMTAPAETLHGFLVSWLSYHILGEDQAMAREMVRVKSGMSPVQAHELETSRGERSTSALLGALQMLYSVLSRLNRDLAKANSALEIKVEERTQQLSAAHEKLQAEHRELTDLLDRINEVQSQLIQSEKMASIGQLAAGVAHEINNPISYISANLATLSRSTDPLLALATLGATTPAGQVLCHNFDFEDFKSDLPALLQESRVGLARVGTIVSNLMDFSGAGGVEWQLVDLLAGLESTINVVGHKLQQKVEIVRDLQPLPPVRCVPAQINQVFMSLLLNAAQAISQRGTIMLRSRVEDNQVCIEVADTGCGMDEASCRRMFEPFFTTKPVGSGTGLGMSLAYDIINKHAGSIKVQSAPDQGTRIRIWLPVDGPAC